MGKKLYNLKSRLVIGLLSVAMLFSGTVITSFAATGSRNSMKNEETNVKEMEVHFLDVGQGDATLITCDGHSMLIDAGDNSKGTTVQLYLRKANVKELDYLILTHPDSDHIGGADVIITKYKIGAIFMSSYKKDTRTYEDVINALDYKHKKWSTPKFGDEYKLGSAKITFISPDGKYEDANNSSLAFIVENGKNKFLFTGDAEEEKEADIVNNIKEIKVDVYQAGHHGSKTSSSKALLEATKPDYAVISCEEGNSHGHPHAEVLNRLRANKIKVFRTDEQGTIVATSNGEKITWNAAPSESWKAGEQTGSNSSSKKDNSSSKKESKKVVAVTEQSQEASKTQEVQQPATTGSAAQYVLNTNTHKFHIPGCGSVKQMKESNKELFNGSRDEAINRGYVPCKKCNP